MALLVAIFRARPSPFYVLDEIEAALDDVNLRRLISLMEELREASQLIVITHQKPTMEVADALYGVSMRGDGITTVITQRLRAAEPAPPDRAAPAGRQPRRGRRRTPAGAGAHPAGLSHLLQHVRRVDGMCDSGRRTGTVMPPDPGQPRRVARDRVEA